MKRLGELLVGLVPDDLPYDRETPIFEITSDSRRVRPGTLFIAIQGFEADGHAYISEAIERGAVAILCEKPPVFEASSRVVIRVLDTRVIQAELAARFFDFPARKLTIHGITGTNGKTTSAFLFESILRHAGIQTGLIGTVLYRWRGQTQEAGRTTPDAIDIQRLFAQMVRDGVEAVVMEVSSHALALERVRGIAFRSALFTNLSRDHLDFHKTFEAYAEAKARLFRMIEGGVGVVNGDDPASDRMIREATGPIFRFGINASELDYRISGITQDETGTVFTLSSSTGSYPLKTPLWGRFNVYNAGGVAALGLAVGLDPQAIREGLRSVERIPGRMEGFRSPHGYRVVVDYAHTPDALDNVLRAVRDFTEGRLIAVFGCGGDRDRGKRPEMGRIGAERADLLFITSDNPRTESPDAIIRDILSGIPAGRPVQVIADRQAAIHAALEEARDGDTVVIAGKGHETYQEIGRIKYPFDDREVVLRYFEKKEEGCRR